MLTITRFKPGTRASDITNYCENGAVRGTAQKREDYYTEKGQAGGYLVGSGWAIYGLSKNNYNAQHIQRALDGQDIATGQVLIPGMKNKQGEPTRVPGWDLTFSADKSISVAFARGNDEFKAAVIKAQEYAVERVVQYIEQNVLTVNVGKAGRERDTSKLLCSGHNHATGRPTKGPDGGMIPGDPDIHSHMIFANFTIRADGKAMSLNTTDIYLRKRELGAVYRAAMADYLKKDMGLHIDKHGEHGSLIRIAGSPKDVERAMSKRRQEIEDYEQEILDAMDKYGITKGAATDFVAQKTRNAKTVKGVVEMTTEDVQAHWEQQLDELGYTKEVFDKLVASSMIEEREYKLSNDDIINNVTQFNSVFSEFDLREAVAFAGAGILSVSEIENKFNELMNGDEIIRVSKRTQNPKTGKWTTFFAYTTQEMIIIDREMIALAKELRSSDDHKIDIEIVNRMRDEFELKKGFKIGEDQAMALYAATTGGDLVIIEGYAGSGKTAGIVIAKDALESAGFNVLGCAPSGKAAKGLESAGIDSVTIARLLMDNKDWFDDEGKWHAAKRPLTNNDVIVVDECGMVGSRDWHALERAAKDAGAKLVFMGDRSQIQSVAAGGSMAAVVNAIGGVDATLTTVHRQKEGTDIARVVAFSRTSDIHKSLDILEDMGCLALVSDKKEGINTTVDAWKKYYDHNSHRAEETSIMLANTNTDVDRLNTIAQGYLKEIGALNLEKSITIDVTDKWGSYTGQKEFFENDRIVFLKNSKIGAGKNKEEVKNGETGRIVAIEDNVLTVKMDGSKRSVRFSAEDYSRISHAYALTTHKSQGITVDHASILGGGGMQTLNQTYVQLSRVRHAVDFVIPKQDIELQMANAEPSEKMIWLAKETADKHGHDLDTINISTFLDCRNYLNDYSKWVIDGKPESETERWRREIGSLVTQMSTLDIKETTLDYEIADKMPGVVNVYTNGELSLKTDPMPIQYNGEPTRAIDTSFDKDGDKYKWKDTATVAFFIDQGGNKVKVKSKADEAIQASLELAKEKFGNTIKAHGSESYRQKTWLLGKAMMNMDIQGYEPSKEDIAELERIIEAREAKNEVEVYDYQNTNKQQENEYGLAM
jgi:conjugative relaxase-like TrwC/TraI family protein